MLFSLYIWFARGPAVFLLLSIKIDWGWYRGTDKCLSITGSIFFLFHPFFDLSFLSASFSFCIHAFFFFLTLSFMCKVCVEKVSSWCWSKELVLPFFHFLSLPQPLSPSTCLPEHTGEGCFFTESRYEGFGHDSSLFMLSATASKGCIKCRFCQC